MPRSFRRWMVAAVMMGSLAARADSPTSRPRLISVTGSEQNPYSYIYGSVAKGNLIQDGRGRFATNVTFQPRYASEVFSESVLFCGNRATAFNGLDGPVVVTYKRIPHQMLRGVPCFDLVSVDRVDADQAGPQAMK